MNPSVKKLKKEELDINQLASVLAESVMDDPFSKYFFPDDTKRRYQLPYLIRSFIHYANNYGEIFVLTTPTGEYCGGSLWLDSDHPTVSPLGLILTMLKPSVVKIFWHLGFKGLYRIMHYGDFIEKEHLKQPKRHYYLMTLGIASQWQNRGLGYELIKTMIEKARIEKIPCYLETQNPMNHNFYFKHGFRIVTEMTPKGCPTFWGMSN